MDLDTQSESRAFGRWLKRHNNQLRQYAPDEIARLAMACGFELKTTCPLITDQVAYLQRLIKFWESPLSGKWLRLTLYERGND